MERHKRDHHLKCDICEEQFTNSQILTEHKLSCCKIPYNCNVCKSSFNRLFTWESHICIPAKQSEELVDDCFKVEIKEEIPLDIYDEID